MGGQRWPGLDKRFYMRLLSVVACLFLLGACSSIPQFAGAEAASVVVTDKTFTDHIVSLGSGKNCSTLRTQADLTYCEEDEVAAKYVSYCYRTLGNVTCYDRPNPFNGRQQIIDEKLENPAKAVGR
jgi:hypothetical protein